MGISRTYTYECHGCGRKEDTPFRQPPDGWAVPRVRLLLESPDLLVGHQRFGRDVYLAVCPACTVAHAAAQRLGVQALDLVHAYVQHGAADIDRKRSARMAHPAVAPLPEARDPFAWPEVPAAGAGDKADP